MSITAVKEANSQNNKRELSGVAAPLLFNFL
jgi:hypothetical protein